MARHRNKPTTKAGLTSPLSGEPWQFDPDHPIAIGYKDDRLGYRSVANMLASSLLKQAASHGLVVSIEGLWGSGKSSLVNLLEDELKRTECPPSIVRFEPWLVGDRDRMLAELMSSLSSAVLSIALSEGTQDVIVKEEAKALAKKIFGYASTLSRQADPLARLAGYLGVPWGETIAKSLEATSKAIESSTSSPTPLELKRELASGLKTIDRTIVVIIDDLDRLEPREAAELTRLIRAVADFPNVIYILCYDPAVLASHLQNSVAVDDGAAFLEKIVQITFKVPQPEEFDLRRWLLNECVAFHGSTADNELTEDETRRLYSVCDIDGEILKTPRDVVRIMNAIKLHWSPVHEDVDYADLVWLQMTKIKNRELYALIERYLTEYAALTDGAFIDEAHRVKVATELKKYLTEGGPTDPRSMWRIKQYIPGIRPGKPNGESVLNHENEKISFGRQRTERILNRCA